MKLIELQKLAARDPALRALTREEEERLIAELEEFRKNKITGMRAGNTAAARDFVCTTDNIVREVSRLTYSTHLLVLIHLTTKLDNLAERTGAYGFYFSTRGHINDTSQPTWYGTHNSMQFVEDVLKQDPETVARLFEQWACSKEESEAITNLEIV